MTTPAKKYLSEVLKDVYFGLLSYQENLYPHKVALMYLNQVAMTDAPINQDGAVVTPAPEELFEIVKNEPEFGPIYSLISQERFSILGYYAADERGEFSKDATLGFNGGVVVYDSLKYMLYQVSDNIEANVRYFTQLMKYHKQKSNRVIILVDFDMDDEDIEKLTSGFSHDRKEFIYLSNHILEADVKDGYNFVVDNFTGNVGVPTQMTEMQSIRIMQAADEEDIKVKDIKAYGYGDIKTNFSKYFNIVYPPAMEKVLNDDSRQVSISDIIDIFGGDDFAKNYTPKFNELRKTILKNIDTKHVVYTALDDNYGTYLIEALLNRLEAFSVLKHKVMAIHDFDVDNGDIVQKIYDFNNNPDYKVLIIPGYYQGMYLENVSHFHIMDDGLQYADNLLIDTCRGNKDRTLQVYLHYSVNKKDVVDKDGNILYTVDASPITFYDSFRMVDSFMGTVLSRRKELRARFARGLKVTGDSGTKSKCVVIL